MKTILPTEVGKTEHLPMDHPSPFANSPESLHRFSVLKKRPWLFLLLLFVLSVVTWIAFIVVAVRNAPEVIEVETAGHQIPANDV